MTVHRQRVVSSSRTAVALLSNHFTNVPRMIPHLLIPGPPLIGAARPGH